jgi:hypothetical protein
MEVASERPCSRDSSQPLVLPRVQLHWQAVLQVLGCGNSSDGCGRECARPINDGAAAQQGSGQSAASVRQPPPGRNLAMANTFALWLNASEVKAGCLAGEVGDCYFLLLGTAAAGDDDQQVVVTGGEWVMGAAAHVAACEVGQARVAADVAALGRQWADFVTLDHECGERSGQHEPQATCPGLGSCNGSGSSGVSVGGRGGAEHQAALVTVADVSPVWLGVLRSSGPCRALSGASDPAIALHVVAVLPPVEGRRCGL